MSNHIQRILIAIVGIPLIIVLCLAGGVYFFAFVAILSAIALHEFYKLTEAKGAKPLSILGLIVGLIVNVSFYHSKLKTCIVSCFESQGILIPFPSQAQLLLMILLVAIAVFTIIELFRNNGSVLMNLSSTIFGILYVSLFFGTFIGLRELFVPFDFPISRFFPEPTSYIDPIITAQVYVWGGYTVLSVLVMIWICDSAAYYGGRVVGRHKLFLRVSPNKTWEGAVFGFIFSIVTAIAAKYLVLDYLSIGSAIIIGFIVGVFGQVGDLVESLFKRDAGVKDSSNLIPGHGGVLDRFDSLLSVSPLVYLYLDFILFS